MTLQDVKKCDQLHVQVNGFSRHNEIALFMQYASVSQVIPHVICDNNNIVAYSTGNLGGHTICPSLEDFLTFLSHSHQIHKHPPTRFHIFPRLNPGLVQLFMQKGMRIAKSCNLMVKGEYDTPKDGFIYVPHIF